MTPENTQRKRKQKETKGHKEEIIGLLKKLKNAHE